MPTVPSPPPGNVCQIKNKYNFVNYAFLSYAFLVTNMLLLFHAYEFIDGEWRLWRDENVFVGRKWYLWLSSELLVCTLERDSEELIGWWAQQTSRDRDLGRNGSGLHSGLEEGGEGSQALFVRSHLPSSVPCESLQHANGEDSLPKLQKLKSQGAYCLNKGKAEIHL